MLASLYCLVPFLQDRLVLVLNIIGLKHILGFAQAFQFFFVFPHTCWEKSKNIKVGWLTCFFSRNYKYENVLTLEFIVVCNEAYITKVGRPSLHGPSICYAVSEWLASWTNIWAEPSTKEKKNPCSVLQKSTKII